MPDWSLQQGVLRAHPALRQWYRPLCYLLITKRAFLSFVCMVWVVCGIFHEHLLRASCCWHRRVDDKHGTWQMPQVGSRNPFPQAIMTFAHCTLCTGLLKGHMHHAVELAGQV